MSAARVDSACDRIKHSNDLFALTSATLPQAALTLEAGVKAVTIHDTANTTPVDVNGNFYLSQSDIGNNRAESTLPKLQNLNPHGTKCCGSVAQQHKLLGSEGEAQILALGRPQPTVPLSPSIRSKLVIH